MRAVRRSWLLSLSALASLGFGPLPAEAAPLDWRRALPLAGLAEASALAFDPGQRRFAVGGADGVHLWQPGSAPRRVLRRGPVRDLLFASRGALYVASARGLFHVGPDASVREISLGGAGEGTRDVLRLARAGGRLFVATAAGLFASDDARSWRVLSREGPVAALAAREARGASELLWLADGRLREARLAAGPVASARFERARDPLPGWRCVDVAVGLPGAARVVLGEDRVFASDASGAGLQPLPAALPPGAEPRRLLHAAGRFWIATDRGLLEADLLAGPWRRAPSPAGGADTFAVAGDAERLLAAAASGVYEARASAAPTRALAAARVPSDPPVVEVQRAALRYLELEPARLRSLRAGVARRGWLPRLDLHADYARGRRRSRDTDEVYSSGATRALHDAGQARDRDWELGLGLVWDLGDTAYHPESVDVSREARELIELRDEVLDEITQLYFERQRALDERAAAPAEARRGPALRAQELAAGLDAWTGGWFAERLAARRDESPPGSGTETAP